MASKFSEFIDQHKLDSRRILSASRHLERLRLEDRQLKAAKKKGGEKEAAGDEEKSAPAKPRSGRPVTPRLLAQAGAGEAISGPAKTRLLRAINRLLEQKKKDTVELKALF